MTVGDFIQHYGSNDDDELVRLEQYHLDFVNTLEHFATDKRKEFEGTGRAFNMHDMTLGDLQNWLREKVNQ